MCKEIDQIKSIIDDNEIRLSWLAKELGGTWNRHNLHYLLNCGKEISVTAYREIMRVLDRHGYSAGATDPLCTTLMQEVSKINQNSAELVNVTIDAAADHQLTRSEKADIRLQISLIKKRITQLEELINER